MLSESAAPRSLSQYAIDMEATQGTEEVQVQKDARGRLRVDLRENYFQRELLCYLLTYFFQTTNLVSLWALCPLDDVEFDFISFFQAFVTLTLDGAVMDEDVCPAFTAEESVAFCVVEPLYRAFILCQWTDSLFSCLSDLVTATKCTATVRTLNRL